MMRAAAHKQTIVGAGEMGVVSKDADEPGTDREFESGGY